MKSVAVNVAEVKNVESIAGMVSPATKVSFLYDGF